MTKSKKHSGKAAVIGIVLLVLAGIWGLFRLNSGGDERPDGGTAEQRIEYIKSFGWDVGIAPTLIKEIRIPAVFDEAYEQYNAIQREQGFDLRKYRACYAYQYTYDILNYSAPSTVPICANLIVCEGKIIGADISSAEANGLVTVLAKK
ncbi:MAG: DUF4830 domain-containing protein [Oscillospiraceae bacterium]|nr:DUF4830 domain-containing protein [Oscillospiraceae bacterium]